jgi:hypothetical protein
MRNILVEQPQTVEEAVNMLADAVTPEEREAIRTQEPPKWMHHFGLGIACRNSWHLWDKNAPLSKDFGQKYNLFCCGDDISGLLLAAARAKVKGEDWETVAKNEAEKYRRHWIRYGVNPETGEKIPGHRDRFRVTDDGQVVDEDE